MSDGETYKIFDGEIYKISDGEKMPQQKKQRIAR